MKTQSFPRLKKTIFWALLIALTWLAIEVGIVLVYRLIQKAPFPR